MQFGQKSKKSANLSFYCFVQNGYALCYREIKIEYSVVMMCLSRANDLKLEGRRDRKQRTFLCGAHGFSTTEKTILSLSVAHAGCILEKVPAIEKLVLSILGMKENFFSAFQVRQIPLLSTTD